MSAFSKYQKIYGNLTQGQARKEISDEIINNTWYEDIASRNMYLYDWYHDLKSPEKHLLRNLNPTDDEFKQPLEIKYTKDRSQRFGSDQVEYHIQMRPGQTCNVDYFDEAYANVYGNIFPVGLYGDIANSDGIYNRFLIVSTADYYVNQFPTYAVLPCNYVINWVFENTTYQMAGVYIPANSYSDGLSTGSVISTADDQAAVILPLNRASENLWMNQRILLDANIKGKPHAWKMGKVNRVSSLGIVQISLIEDLYNDNTDYVERDSDGNITAMYADYYNGGLTPDSSDETDPSEAYAVITYKGAQNSTIKVGGSARTFVITFYDADGNELPFEEGTWSFSIGEVPADDLVEVQSTTEENQLKVRFIGGNSYISNVLTVTYTSVSGITDGIDMNIAGL